MKKVISKLGKIILTFVLATMFIFADTQCVDAATESIKLGSATMLPGYIAGTKFHIKTLKSGGYAYCLNLHKTTAQNVTEYLEKELGAGTTYILENGYPNKSFTGNKKYDFYITQAAVWWYLDDTTGTSYLSSSFKGNGSDTHGLRKYIKKLVSGAKDAKSKGYTSPSLNAKTNDSKMNMSADGNYFTSKVDANAKNITGDYKVTITSAPSGSYIADVNGNKKSKFGLKENFLIVIPGTKVAEGKTVTAKVKVTASRSFNKAYKYSAKDTSIQPMTILQPYTKTVTDTISVKATRAKTPVITTVPTPTPTPIPTPTPTESSVSILKLDKNTNSSVAGATLVVKDANGVEVKRFVSTNDAYVIKGLANGTYTVEEAVAPAGYELSTEKQSFTFNESVRTAEVKYYNKAKDSVVSIVKLDKATNNLIAGAELVVRDANGNEIKRFTSSVNGYTITGLTNGTYTVEEVKAPTGYKLSTEKQSFTLSDAIKTVEVKFFNEAKNPVVTISKIDGTTGEVVSGAEIVITNANGEEVARFTSSDEAYVLENLADGTYNVKEVEAPEGYFLNEEVQTFTIDDDHLSYQITIKDVPKTCENGGLDDDECSVDVPNTGSSTIPFYLIGITIILSGLGYVYKNNKKAIQK